MHILPLSVEGLTRPKRDVIQHTAGQHHENIILFKETRSESENKIQLEGF